ncbi:MAG TPA: glycosyltransferase [Burkholderiales bacterium]|nr:glycosyltransferase [Burkholderiales bacterium]
MKTRLHSHILMLGAAPETRSGIAAVVESYRAHGLFARWPIEYVATTGDGSALRETQLLGGAMRDFALSLLREPHALVHVHLSERAFWRQAPFAAAALAARRPLVVQLHGPGFGGEAAPLLERAACVVVACEAQRVWVRSVAKNAHVVTVPPAVGVAAQGPAGESAPRPNVVLFLGRLEAGKGIYDLLDALAGVRAAVPDVRLVCAGDGDRAGVARYAERLGIADAVKFTGWVGPSGKRALLETAAAFALPSYDEALPASLVEAMSAGVPPLASPVGGIPEVVQDGVSGLLVAPGDRANLERRLKRLLLDRPLAGRLGAAARESARLRFSPERVLPRLEAIYAAAGVVASSAAPGREADLERAA